MAVGRRLYHYWHTPVATRLTAAYPQQQRSPRHSHTCKAGLASRWMMEVVPNQLTTVLLQQPRHGQQYCAERHGSSLSAGRSLLMPIRRMGLEGFRHTAIMQCRVGVVQQAGRSTAGTWCTHEGVWEHSRAVVCLAANGGCTGTVPAVQRCHSGSTSWLHGFQRCRTYSMATRNGAGVGATDAAHNGLEGSMEYGWQGRWDHLRNVCLVIAYDGTRYHGFQLQSNRETIQLFLERALSNVTRESRQQLKLVTAGRTDAGVHALGQVVSFLTARFDLSLEAIQVALNGQLPWTIRVLAAADVPASFHARYCAVRKTYRYHLLQGPDASPFLFRYRARLRRSLDIDAVRECAQLFVGKHDFTQFANLSVTDRDPVKTLQRLQVTQPEPNLIRFEFEGNAFLYKQVRHMVGACCAVGQGKMTLQHIEDLLQAGSNRPIGRNARPWTVAEAQGLMLAKVQYPEEYKVPAVAAACPMMSDAPDTLCNVGLY